MSSSQPQPNQVNAIIMLFTADKASPIWDATELYMGWLGLTGLRLKGRFLFGTLCGPNWAYISNLQTQL